MHNIPENDGYEFEDLNPELIQKFVNCENREELLQQISHNELLQLLQIAD